MKKLIVAICIIMISATTYAQKGTTQIGVGADLGIPTGDFGDVAKTGFGGYAKGLFGIGEAGQITFTTGYTTYKIKGAGSGSNLNIVPLLAGYRHNFSGFYAEPQLGYGIYGVKLKGIGSDSGGAFTWAVGFGYAMNGLDIGVRYQSGDKDELTRSLVGIHVGYNFSLGGK
ncbi:MAG TPA: hypothetical protein VK644_04895 [Chitinophagaceae bacterium]|nr:hypothetical protein [Chitinophagaceae bacterium]